MEDPAGPQDKDDTCVVVNNGKDTTYGGVKKPEEKTQEPGKTKEEPKQEPVEPQKTAGNNGVTVIVNVNNNNGTDNTIDQKTNGEAGGVVTTNSPKEEPKEPQKEESESEKPVDKSKPEEKPVACDPKLEWTISQVEGQYRVSLSLKNGGGVLYGHIVVDYPSSCLLAKRIDWYWEQERIREPEIGRLSFDVRNPGVEKICDIIFDPKAAGSGIIGISSNSAFYKSGEDFDKKQNVVPIPFPKVLNVEVK
ncbi:MAG: hypothetical protein PHN39_01780 [Candidatus Pacebacteria bacterium]|nr:hypothetical protein [Candidatus Paceibacterota bacterium]